MSKHISYENRRKTNQAEPVYIGFDEPEMKAKKPSNAFGAAAVFFGVVGLLMTGIAVSAILTFLRDNYIVESVPFGVRLLVPFVGILISTLALVFAFIGIFKRPRRYAVLGGLLGLIPIVGVIGLERHFEHLIHHKETHRALHVQRNITNSKIREAIKDVLAFEKEKGRWPEGLEGNKLVVRKLDSWNNALRYETNDNGFTIRSAGPDGVFETADDCKSTTRASTVYTTSSRR